MTSPSCARPACPGRAAAWLAYDYEARCAWLDDQQGTGEDNSHRWPLCERHADNLRVPRGWFCVDRRSSRGGQRPDGQEAMLLPGSGPGVVGPTAGAEAAGTGGGAEEERPARSVAGRGGRRRQPGASGDGAGEQGPRGGRTGRPTAGRARRGGGEPVVAPGPGPEGDGGNAGAGGVLSAIL